MKQTFRMKPLAFTRLLAEVTVGLLILLLPLAIWLVPQLQQLPTVFKVAGYVLSVASLFFLPLYGFATVEVAVDDREITTVSLFKRQCCLWTDIRKLQLKTDWGWRRYFVECEGGGLTFPALLHKQEDLLQIIRRHMPQSQSRISGPRVFKQDMPAVAWQYAQLITGVVFLILLWWFFATTGIAKSTQFADMTLILFVCLVVTAVLIWRAVVIVFMPLHIEIADAEIIVVTCLGRRRIAWKDIRKLSNALPFLPDGVMLSTKSGQLLLSDNLSDADELKAIIGKRLNKS